MDDELAHLPAFEMMARRDAGQREIAEGIGHFLFAFSRLDTSLHLAWSWVVCGGLGRSHSESFGVRLKSLERRLAMDLSGRARERSRDTFERVRKLSERRNVLAHSRWGMEAYGRHAIAVSTPVGVEPQLRHEVTATLLKELTADCDKAAGELAGLSSAWQKLPRDQSTPPVR